MTVCIAAICENDKIVGAADRLITAGDIQFEPERPKIIELTRSIYAMFSGDSDFGWELLQEIASVVTARVTAEPERWWTLREVSSICRVCYGEARLRLAEASILAPLGLNRKTFIQEQARMESGLVRQIAADMTRYRPPRVSVILTGVDPTGPHIYVIENGESRLADLSGFAAIGMGAGHAESRFMYARHTSQKSLPETLLLTYSAKKHAEIAPGIGSDTDMVLIGPLLGMSLLVDASKLAFLDRIHRATQEELRLLEEKARQEITGHFAALQAEVQQQGQGDIVGSGGESHGGEEGKSDD